MSIHRLLMASVANEFSLSDAASVGGLDKV